MRLFGADGARRFAACVCCIVAAASIPGIAAVDDARYRDGCSSLDANPARGAAPGWWHVLKKSGNEPGSPMGFCSWLWEIGEFSGGNEYNGERPKPGCVGGVDAPLTDDALAAVSNTLVNARANGAIMIIRFGYTSRDVKGAEPSDFNTIVGHVRQLGKILGAFPDVVLAVECGMTGPWGEMHSNNYREPHHIRAIGDAWLGTLARETALLVRYPMWILQYAGKNTDEFMRDVAAGAYYKTQPAQKRIGMFNDGYLGTTADYGTWRSGENWMNRDQGVAYLEARRNVPYGGELAHISEAEAEAVELFDLSKFNIVREFYRTHLNYLRNIDTPGHVLAHRIEKLTLTHDYDFQGMPDLSEWYGKDLRRFIREHMGYRFVIRGVKRMPNAFAVNIENTGFGHLLIRNGAEIVIDGKAYPIHLDLRTLRAGETRTYEIKPPNGMRLYKSAVVGLRLFTAAKPRRPILFANDALWDAATGSFILR
ncbi:MAG: DUF4874 domain-containing protein [Kiritimatiellae bacterium]|nr:DUF4874 domain-containing protein [Kiritimatiellia bacterium]